MFIWIRSYLGRSPEFAKFAQDEDPERAFIDDVMEKLINDNVLLVPGYHYYPWEGADKVTTKARGLESGIGYFRLAYSMPVVSAVSLSIRCA